MLKLNENASQSSLEELGQDIIAAYNALINVTYSPCEDTAKYRQITNISAIASTVSRDNMRSRSFLQDLSMTEIIFRLDGRCGGCDSDGKFFGPDVASSDDFVAYYSGVVDSGLDYLTEIVTLDCPSNSTTFEDWIIMEFVPEDIYNDSLINNDILIQQLEEIYVETYNELALDYCDPHSRYLVGSSNVYGNIPVELHLVGTCANCNNIDVDVFDSPSDPAPVLAVVVIWRESCYYVKSKWHMLLYCSPNRFSRSL